MTDRTFRDTSTECAICLESLDTDNTIELSCGHRWHLSCIATQIQISKPNSSHRLLFSGCRCPKCGSFCDHEALRHLTRSIDNLRGKVDNLIEEQLKNDMPDEWNQAGSDKGHLLEVGRSKYAFYLCSSCKDPYFGGTVNCADLDEGILPSENRLCPSCHPLPQEICEHADLHQASHVWKCRYCCSPSTFLCYGSVHFCSDCHSRNDVRVRQQRPGSTGPPELESIPCQGDSCTHPKRHNQLNHRNGNNHHCEQIYSCIICETSEGIPESLIPSGSTNFVVNPSGEQGFTGWTQFGLRSWEIETSRVPVKVNITTNFVSSYIWCQMHQLVPLHLYVNDVSSARIEVSAKYMARFDCRSMFRLEAIILDSNGACLQKLDTRNLDAPVDCWERASLIFEPTQGAHEVVIVIHGKDC